MGRVGREACREKLYIWRELAQTNPEIRALRNALHDDTLQSFVDLEEYLYNVDERVRSQLREMASGYLRGAGHYLLSNDFQPMSTISKDYTAGYLFVLADAIVSKEVNALPVRMPMDFINNVNELRKCVSQELFLGHILFRRNPERMHNRSGPPRRSKSWSPSDRPPRPRRNAQNETKKSNKKDKKKAQTRSRPKRAETSSSSSDSTPPPSPAHSSSSSTSSGYEIFSPPASPRAGNIPSPSPPPLPPRFDKTWKTIPNAAFRRRAPPTNCCGDLFSRPSLSSSPAESPTDYSSCAFPSSLTTSHASSNSSFPSYPDSVFHSSGSTYASLDDFESIKSDSVSDLSAPESFRSLDSHSQMYFNFKNPSLGPSPSDFLFESEATWDSHEHNDDDDDDNDFPTVDENVAASWQATSDSLVRSKPIDIPNAANCYARHIPLNSRVHVNVTDFSPPSPPFNKKETFLFPTLGSSNSEETFPFEYFPPPPPGDSDDDYV